MAMDIESVPHLPAGAVDHLVDAGIESLYPPQEAAVEAGVTEGSNLVASVPTASGKTLIAKLAMLAAIERGGRALYIVPLRALASEKREDFASFEALDIEVGVATGNYEGRGEWLADADVIVATSEKVDSLIRNGASWIEDLACVVADEVHLIDDATRGPTLEVTLAKLRRLNTAVQVVALSATVANGETLAEWLDAELIDTDWRPIDLRRGVHYGNAITFADGEQTELPVGPSQSQTAAIARDTLEDGGSTLVFVNSRRNAESAADRLGGAIDSALAPDDRRALATLAEDVRAVSDTDTSDDLAACVASGTAFHHAGLESEHRSLIEDAFRDRLLKVVVATPTLAAGVNTPSRRVVVRDWQRYDGTAGGMRPLPVLEVHQMMGRAGRPGRDPYGEALLLADSHDEQEELFDRYLYANPEPVESKLAAEPALRTHVLAAVATGFTRSRDGLREFFGETLYASQTTEAGRLERVLDEVLWYLEANDFIERTDDAIEATALGHTVSRLYVDPMSAAEIVDGLRTLGDDSPSAFGLYHLIARTPDLYELYLRSGDDETYTEVHYERQDEFLGSAPSEFDDTAFEDWLAAVKTAKLLEDWARECDEDTITDRYQIGPGDIRSKVDAAEWLLGAAEDLAAELDLAAVTSIRTARRRVQHGVNNELLELVSVEGVGRKRARRLYEAGIETPSDLRTADKDVILEALRGREGTAERILEAAGRDDPGMEAIDTTATDLDHDDQEESAGQASLGDFP